MKTHENWRSQLFGRGVDFAESIFLLARLAESIFRDVMNLILKGKKSEATPRVAREDAGRSCTRHARQAAR